MSYYKYIEGIKWYYCLIPKENSKALFTDYPRNSLFKKFLVCWDFTENTKNMKMYSVFPNYLDFVKFFLKIPKHLKCFYEIILGECLQKPHFDLDIVLNELEIIERKDEIVLNDLINAIVLILGKKNIVLNLEKDICIYSSHGETKKSYHIVINSYCHSNNKEAKAFYYAVMGELPEEYFKKKLIDHAVYSKTQQFRTYQSSKFGSKRVKEIVQEWKYNGEIIKHINHEIPEDENHNFLINFEESMITARTSTCKILPIFEIIELNDYSKGEDLDRDLAMEAIQLLAHKAGTTPEDRMFPYRFDKIDGPFVILKRVKPSKCQLCNRIHQHQNPYLLIVPETKNVFFHCRRASPKQKLYVGCLKTDDIVEEPKKNEPKEISINWTQQKINDLKHIASSSNPIEKKNKTENLEMKTSIINNINKKIIEKWI